MKQELALPLMVFGALLLLASLLADVLGFGGAPGFGWKQITGSFVGIGCLGVGYFFQKTARSPK